MTKDEIYLKNGIHFSDRGFCETDKHCVGRAMDQYGRQEAIEFRKWYNDNFIVWNSAAGYYFKSAGEPLESRPSTNEQLYELFKEDQTKSLKNEPRRIF